MKKVAVLLAEGYEEGESLETTDILRRCGITCVTVSIKEKTVTGCNGITVLADRLMDETDFNEFDMLVLPGGMPGAKNLKEDERVIQLVRKFMKERKYVAAICAAPIVLKEAGVTEGRRVTSYPADQYRNLFTNSEYVEDELVVQDGNLITSRGPATVFPFAYHLAKVLGGNVETVKERMLYNRLVESWKN